VAAFVDSSGSDFPDAPELWLPYFLVENLDARLRQAEALGATLLRPALAISAAGRIALIRQPGGAIVGWISASPAG
jgi:predicted enzyme related to lactoylglutathione lyase